MDQEIERQKWNEKLSDIYHKSYKKLLIVPTVLLFLSVFLIIYQVTTTGDFINRGVSLKGGVTITIPSANSIDSSVVENVLREKYPAIDLSIREVKRAGEEKGLIIDADVTDKKEINELTTILENKFKLTNNDYSEETMGASLGNAFFKQTFIALIFAFLFMSGVVFLYFRVPTPSLAVILAAFSDIISTLAIVNLLGMKLTTAGIAAFLMLIGYSVDTDILLSTRVLKNKLGVVQERINDAMKTGFMMSATTLGAVIVGLISSQSEVLIQIMTILLIGLLVDLVFTWLQNAVLLRMYVEKRGGHV